MLHDLIAHAGRLAPAVPQGVAIALLGACTVTDLRSRRIPNALLLAGALAGVVVRLALEGPHGLVASLLPTALCAAFMGVLAARRWLGFGDAKLITCVVLIAGWYATLYVLLYGSLLACAWVLAGMARRGELSWLWRRPAGATLPAVPFAPFLLVGGILVALRA
jgi:Flp pilus assembly protein protease CpaA